MLLRFSITGSNELLCSFVLTHLTEFCLSIVGLISLLWLRSLSLLRMWKEVVWPVHFNWNHVKASHPHEPDASEVSMTWGFVLLTAIASWTLHVLAIPPCKIWPGAQAQLRKMTTVERCVSLCRKSCLLWLFAGTRQTSDQWQQLPLSTRFPSPWRVAFSTLNLSWTRQTYKATVSISMLRCFKTWCW